MTTGVHLEFSKTDTVDVGVLRESLVEVGLFEPLNTFRNGADGACGDLCVDAVHKTLVKVTFYCLLVLEHLYIVVHLLERCENDGLAFFVELRTASTTEDLLDVENAKIFVGACGRVVDLSALDYDTVSWKVYTPSQCAGRTQDLDVAIVEHILDKIPILPQHACMMDTKPELKELLHLVVPRSRHFFPD